MSPQNSYIATLVERHSRYVMLVKVANKDTESVVSALIKLSRRLPRELYKSLTWDRGKELTVSAFTRFHQLSVNGKTSEFSRSDLKHLAEYAGLPRGREIQILEQVQDAFSNWETVAGELDIPPALQRHIARTIRIDIK